MRKDTRSSQERNEYRRNLHSTRREAFFSGRSCAFCGSTENLELDHIDPTTKDPYLRRKSNHFIWRWSEERRNAELAKCQVLCHPCHVEKSRREGNFTYNTVKGSSHGSSKLNEVQVIQIRALADTGVLHTVIADQFGVSDRTINKIVNRVTWRHL